MEPYELLASLKRRRKAIVDEVEQMRVDQARWNAIHPGEEPLDEVPKIDARLAQIDAGIARMERYVRQ